MKKHILILIIGFLIFNCKNTSKESKSDTRLLFYTTKDSIINQSELHLNFTLEEFVYSKKNDSILFNLNISNHTDIFYLGGETFKLVDKDRYLNLDISSEGFDLYKIDHSGSEKTLVLFNKDYGLLNIYYPEWKVQFLFLKNEEEFKLNYSILDIMEK